jgi:hypothetical protein
MKYRSYGRARFARSAGIEERDYGGGEIVHMNKKALATLYQDPGTELQTMKIERNSKSFMSPLDSASHPYELRENFPLRV